MSSTSFRPRVVYKTLGQLTLSEAAHHMSLFQTQRKPNTPDEVWFAEHPPVYSAGYRDRDTCPQTIKGIPVEATDRGGLITYHGPGQLLCYFLFDLNQRKLGVRNFVNDIEQGLILALSELSILANREHGKPGVYIGAAKIGSIGLRVQHGRTRHGLAINICTDLSPFKAIAPCGESDRQMINLNHLYPAITLQDFIPLITSSFSKLWS